MNHRTLASSVSHTNRLRLLVAMLMVATVRSGTFSDVREGLLCPITFM